MKVRFKSCVVILLIFMSILVMSNHIIAKSTKTPELKHGINLGGMLDSPWGEGTMEGNDNYNLFKDEYVKMIKDSGFDFVRFPVVFSVYADIEAPYKIDEELFDRTDHIIDLFLKNNIAVILDVHNYNELYNSVAEGRDPRYNPMRDPNSNEYDTSVASEIDATLLLRINRRIDPVKEKERFKSIWSQIANHYKSYPMTLLFEFMNEPGTKFALYNELIKETIPVIRNTGSNNKNRDIVISPAWYGAEGPLLKYLEIPKNDKHIIGTFHMYEPFSFTHQGFNWTGLDPDARSSWKETGTNTKEIKKVMNEAKAWSKKTGLKVLMGEFGTSMYADMDSRAAWTNYIARLAEKNGFAWAYWDFSSDAFGVYDRNTKTYNSKLCKALFPNK